MTRLVAVEAETGARFVRHGRYVIDTDRERRCKAYEPETAQQIADQLNAGMEYQRIEMFMWESIPDPNYNRVCGECSEGRDCEQPYVSFDGDTYWCKRIIPAPGQEGGDHGEA